MHRRKFLGIVGRGAVCGAVVLTVPGCSSRARTADEAKRAVARAIYGRDLRDVGLRLMAATKLSGQAKTQFEALLAKARRGEEIDHGVLRAHEKAVEKLLFALWGDDALLWPAVGFPHGPGQCTGFDLYTRPPVMPEGSGGKRS
jgi:hypothetical protein